MSYTPTGDSTLYFVNPCNKDWQNYIFAQENKSLNALGYDGWHGDTVGDWGEMKTSDGNYLYVKDTYTDFLNKAKVAIPKPIPCLEYLGCFVFFYSTSTKNDCGDCSRETQQIHTGNK